MQRELGIHCLCHKLWRCCCHPLTLHRSHYTEEPGKLKRNICVTEECKKKHSSPLMCCLYFHLVLWLSISGLYGYSHNFKICSNSQLVLAPLTHFLRWRCVCTVCVQGGWRWWHLWLPSCQVWKMPLVFLCVCEVPACRGFQASQGWRTVLSSWMSAPTTSLSRKSSWSVMPKVSMRYSSSILWYRHFHKFISHSCNH